MAARRVQLALAAHPRGMMLSRELTDACVPPSRRDEIAFQVAAATSAEKRGMLGYITSRKSDGNCYVDFRDGSSEEKANPP